MIRFKMHFSHLKATLGVIRAAVQRGLLRDLCDERKNAPTNPNESSTVAALAFTSRDP